MFPLELLDSHEVKKSKTSTAVTRNKLQAVFNSFGLRVTYAKTETGPSLTRYSFKPVHTNIDLQKLKSMADNISLALSVPSVRVLAPVPSKPYIGIEVPNAERSIVGLAEMLGGKEIPVGKEIHEGKTLELPIILGKGITGNTVVADLARLPHLLIAGATGSGKSVGVNTIIMSLMYALTPSELQFVMIDPKVVELKAYAGIPYLLEPVVTEQAGAVQVLKKLVAIMHTRYSLLEAVGARNLKAYNAQATKRLPYIVCVIDEFADLITQNRKEVEASLATLSAMARATGIHLILATQRPSVDVITGVIKNNFPSRIAFRVPSHIDSRVVLDESGAETLLGKGDMLYREPSFTHAERIQGCWVADTEVQAVVQWVSQLPAPIQPIIETNSIPSERLARATELLTAYQNFTASFLQRELCIDYDTACELLAQYKESVA